MNDVKTAVKSFAAGAVLMYLFDPNRGKRRRAGIRDKSVKAWHEFANQVDKAKRDASNRVQGIRMQVASLIAPKPDRGHLVERVKSRVGRVVSHPHAIHVTAESGAVVLEGPVLDNEVERLLEEVRAVSGVNNVTNRLEIYKEGAHISSLQGGVPRQSRSEFTQQSWTPALRFAAGGLGCALVSYGRRTQGVHGLAGSLAGTTLLARAIFNKELRQIVGAGGGPRIIQMEKTVHVHAPAEEVFAFWSDYKNFPRFMTHLKEVRDLGSGRSHWVAEGPGGISVSWDAEITQQIQNKLLAWRSTPGSNVETEGVVRFDPEHDGTTRIGLRLCYGPPAGVLGHLIASLFGSDPKAEIDDDMVRLKSLIDIGKTRAHGTRVTREEVLHAGA